MLECNYKSQLDDARVRDRRHNKRSVLQFWLDNQKQENENLFFPTAQKDEDYWHFVSKVTWISFQFHILGEYFDRTNIIFQSSRGVQLCQCSRTPNLCNDFFSNILLHCFCGAVTVNLRLDVRNLSFFFWTNRTQKAQIEQDYKMCSERDEEKVTAHFLKH